MRQGKKQRPAAERLTNVKLDLPLADILAAKAIARRTKKGFQTVLAKVVHDELRRRS